VAHRRHVLECNEKVCDSLEDVCDSLEDWRSGVQWENSLFALSMPSILHNYGTCRNARKKLYALALSSSLHKISLNYTSYFTVPWQSLMCDVPYGTVWYGKTICTVKYGDHLCMVWTGFFLGGDGTYTFWGGHPWAPPASPNPPCVTPTRTKKVPICSFFK